MGATKMRDLQRFNRRLGLKLFVLGCISVVLAVAQVSGPVGSGPRRTRPGTTTRAPGSSPGPGGIPDSPTNLPPVPTRAPNRIPDDQPIFSADTNAVTVDIAIMDNKGQFIPSIPAGNFQILEDGVPQKVVSVGPTEAPATVALLVEFSNRWQQYWSETWYPDINRYLRIRRNATA